MLELHYPMIQFLIIPITQEKLKTMVMLVFVVVVVVVNFFWGGEGVNKVHYGRCENGE